jgi:site-specific DNA-methyltransferase (adenine-specific)
VTQHTLHLGDCREILQTLPDASVDAVVTDPPYGLAFMGKRWDYDVPSVEIWAECLRVLKPGGHLLAFAGTRTQHRMAVRIEDAGFEIRDMIAWVYGSGFPKSLDVSKAIDKAAGEIRPRVAGGQGGANAILGARKCGEAISREAISREAQQWTGWGTALKPALEPVTMARKPLAGTVAACVVEHGTGALNVDGCRVQGGPSPSVDRRAHAALGASVGATGWETAARPASYNDQRPGEQLGRWPANLIHDGSDEVVGLFPQTVSGGDFKQGMVQHSRTYNVSEAVKDERIRDAYERDSSGSAARFFYTAKATKAERQGVTHPTVKPLDLMAYLCRLVTPPGGTVLDPFMGSGTTIKAAIGDGFNAIGIERDPQYFAMAEHRMNGAQLGLLLTP